MLAVAARAPQTAAGRLPMGWGTGGDNRFVGKRKKREAPRGFVDAYKRLRKPMPPPGRVIGDERRRMQDEAARREIEEQTADGGSEER